MTGAGSVSLREIGRVKSAATRVALLPVVDLAGVHRKHRVLARPGRR